MPQSGQAKGAYFSRGQRIKRYAICRKIGSIINGGRAEVFMRFVNELINSALTTDIGF